MCWKCGKLVLLDVSKPPKPKQSGTPSLSHSNS